ncbi:MAG: alpha/beta fold hydrolase [Bdellovibrionota bacterium]
MKEKNIIHSKIIGKGAPLVFLHGWGVDSTLFLDLAELLADNRECHLIDLPGFGESLKPSEVWGTLEYAKCIVDYLKERNIERADILGHSVGGRIALRIAVHYPEYVDNLILISSAGIKSKKFLFRRFKIFIIKKAAKFFKAIDKLLKNNFFKNRFALRFGSRDYRNAGDMKEIFVKIVEENQEHELSKVNARTLLIWGDKDTETPVDMGETFSKKIKDAKLVILKGRGHMPFLGDGAGLCAYQIKEFLK